MTEDEAKDGEGKGEKKKVSEYAKLWLFETCAFTCVQNSDRTSTKLPPCSELSRDQWRG